MPYVLVIFALILLVLVHEFGHFIAARIVGIRATKFYVFFPPALWKKKVGEVEYGVGLIPAGGFVKLPGMFEPEAYQVSKVVQWELDKISTLNSDQQLIADAAKRKIIKATSADQLVDPLRDLRLIISEQPLSGERNSALQRIDDLLDDLHPKAYWRAALWRRMTVIFAGPLVNLLVAFVVLMTFYWGFIPKFSTSGPITVVEVTANSPADKAGITDKSLITNWNGKVKGVSPAELMDRIASGKGKPVTLTFHEKDSKPATKTITPELVDTDGKKVKRLGLVPVIDNVKVVGRRTTGPIIALKATTLEMRDITWGNLSRIPQIFFRKEVRDEVSSVVGIVQVAEQVDKAGQFIRYIGIISLVLAIMNLLPLLPLDGGHLLFGIIEAIRRRPLPRMAFERYSMIGLALVGVLFLIGLNNDIGLGS